MNKITRVLLTLAFLALAGNFAVAKATDRDRDRDKKDYHCREGHHCASAPASAPEIDPRQALGALTLLTGTVAIVRGYRRKK